MREKNLSPVGHHSFPHHGDALAQLLGSTTVLSHHTQRPRMIEKLKGILELSGVAAPKDESRVLSHFEAWLGLGDDSYNGLTVEDCCPLPTPVSEALALLLTEAWKPQEQEEESITSWRRNALLESDLPPTTIRLVDVWPAVQATTWARHLMDLHVEENTNLNEIWMQNETVALQLIPALYHHINELPLWQAQMHQYKQTLQRPPRQQKGSTMDPKERLQAYELAQNVLDRLLQEWQQHTTRLTELGIAWYRAAGRAGRLTARQCLGRVWVDYLYRCEHVMGVGGGGLRQENTQAAGISITLQCLDKILQGLTTIRDSYRRLLTQHLIPLHRPNGLVLWRDQTPVLQLYHESLTRSCAHILRLQPTLIPPTVLALLHKDIFPPAGNTGKQVLLLHEIDTYLGLIPENDWTVMFQQSDWCRELLRTLARCMSSEHSAVAERALQFSKSPWFQAMVCQSTDALSILLPALVRKEPSWNPTVRKMTYLALQSLEGNKDAFVDACNTVFAGRSMIRNEPSAPLPRRSPESKSSTTLPTSASLMPPPSRPSFPKPGRKMPLSSTPGKGVAPWSVASGTNPPLTITGVAPWAMSQQAPPPRRVVPAANPPIQEPPAHESGYDFVTAYMANIKPAEESGGDTASWTKEQMAETPTLLPDLKFHDLVFGRDLGEGAFGSVRYARLIDRSKTRSNWSEFAVKVISTAKIQEFGYEYSVKREIAVLRMLSHPGIARLVSSFRFREGAYLVLEYASGGDLHDFLVKKGSLDEDSTRFVIGEVLAGLQSIHELGLVHIDLKAENILITESGHIKLTDFGGCRPVTPEARARVTAAALNALRDLRDGDWKTQPSSGNEMDHGSDNMDTDGNDDHDDGRLEGTTANLPPEIVMGGKPSFSTDSWALGCVMYQCLTGRPPLLEADENATKKRIVHFASANDDESGQASDDYDEMFGAAHAAGLSHDAKSLIRNLLERDVSRRFSITEAAAHSFFNGTDVFTLYNKPAYPLDVGKNAPSATDAKWARRQFSTIWAPQPEAYDLSSSLDSVNQYQSSSNVFSAPITEGEEADGHFTPIRIREHGPPNVPGRNVPPLSSGST